MKTKTNKRASWIANGRIFHSFTAVEKYARENNWRVKDMLTIERGVFLCDLGK